jgi:hypothetical protein
MQTWNRFGISYFFNAELKCPYVDDKFGIGTEPHVSVRWRIDDGPVHSQLYGLSCGRGGCNGVSYFWRVLSVEGDGYIRRYRSLAEMNNITPGNKYFDEYKNSYVIPNDQMVSLLETGKSIYIRAADRCSSVDTKIDLRGLSEAILRSGITMKTQQKGR